MTRPPRQSNGFTLIELVVYLGVISFTLVTATMYAFEFAATRVKAAALQEVNRNGRLVLSRIALDIREASDINVGGSTFGANPSVLSLAMASAPSNPTIFCVTGTTLRVSLGDASCTSADPALTTSKVLVSEFTVTDLSVAGKTKTYRIHLLLNAASGSAPIEVQASQTFETTATIMRNDGFSN